MLVSSVSGRTPSADSRTSAPTPTPAPAPSPAPSPALAAPLKPDPRANTLVDRQQLEKAVATLNDFTGMAARDVQFSIDQESGKTLVKVIDTRTQEVLRQLPSKEALALAHSLDKMQGLLIHAQA